MSGAPGPHAVCGRHQVAVIVTRGGRRKGEGRGAGARGGEGRGDDKLDDRSGQGRGNQDEAGEGRWRNMVRVILGFFGGGGGWGAVGVHREWGRKETGARGRGGKRKTRRY